MYNVIYEKGRPRPMNGSPIFYELLKSMTELHDRKSHDYASNDDPYGNYRFAGMIASMFSHSPDDMGFVGRLAEKIYRLANLEKGGKIPKNETIEDTELDICVITTLWMAARRDARMKHARMKEPPSILTSIPLEIKEKEMYPGDIVYTSKTNRRKIRR